VKFFGILFGCTVALAAETVVIRNVDVYPVTGPEMKGVSVVLQDGKIGEIGAKIVAPKGARIIEGKGLRVYPGMIDSGTELGLSEVSAVRETVDTGELGEFMPQLRALSAVNPESEHFGVVRVNGITSVMTFPSSGVGAGGGGGRFGGGERQFISGQAALIHTDGWTREDMAIDRTAAIHLIFPTLGGRGGRGGAVPDVVLEMIPGGTGATGFTAAKRTYDQQVAKITEFFEQARQYQKERAARTPGFRPVLKMEAMVPVLEGKVPLAVSASRASVIHDAIAFADKQKIRIVILQPRNLTKIGPELKEKNIPVILGRVLALPEQEDDPYDGSFTQPAEAYKAGVKFAFGTFTNEFVRNLPYQAATAVAFGLPYEEALKAVTINAAQIWGHAAEIGSVEKGKVADLMVTTGDPLSNSTQVKYLFIKGKEVPLMNKQTRLYEKYMSRQ
jgi:imidazolonepropionase-like amidohydrolase